MNTAKYSVERMCYLLGVSRSAYYDWRSAEPKRSRISEQIEQLVLDVFKSSNKTYGSPRICAELTDHGIKVSKSTVARVMRRLKIQSTVKRRFIHTTDSDHDLGVFDNLLSRDFRANEVNTKWVSDITYIKTSTGWVYLTVIVDLADRMIVGWSLSKDLTAANTTVKALKIALDRRIIHKPLLFHSDRGIQYCCSQFVQQIALNKHITQSMSRKGNCWDNAPAESFFKTLKVEVVYKNSYLNLDQAFKSIFDYIERWYNTRRKHSSIDYMSPLQKHYFLTQPAA